MKLYIITQIRNESKRIEEWIRYHSKLGIDKFILIDDWSIDDTEPKIKKLSNEFNIELLKSNRNIGNIVEVQEDPIYGRHPDAYSHCGSIVERQKDSWTMGVRYSKNECSLDDYACFIDVDEFLVPKKDKLKDCIERASYYLYIPTYDFKCPFDINKPIITQTYMRWSDDTKMNGASTHGRVIGHKHRFNERGKTIIKFKHIDQVENLHHILISLQQPIIFNNDIIINHYRNFGDMQIYDQKDKTILNWI